MNKFKVGDKGVRKGYSLSCIKVGETRYVKEVQRFGILLSDGNFYAPDFFDVVDIESNMELVLKKGIYILKLEKEMAVYFDEFFIEDGSCALKVSGISVCFLIGDKMSEFLKLFNELDHG